MTYGEQSGNAGFQNYQAGNGYETGFSAGNGMAAGYGNGSFQAGGDYNGGSHLSGQADPYLVLRGVLENRQMGRTEIQEVLAAVGILKRHNVLGLLGLVNEQQQMQPTQNNMDTMTSPRMSGMARTSPAMGRGGGSELLQRLHSARDGNDFYMDGSGEMPDSMKEFVLGKEFHVCFLSLLYLYE